ncbi:MAG: NAD(P)/FAD-dependent oxidoreductase [Ruminococcus sp.]
MFDIIIIGSGPAGMTAAIYARRASLDALVLEKDAMGSGQIAVTEQVDNYPGLPRIGGYELGEKFREHAEELGASFSENEVAAADRNRRHFYRFHERWDECHGKKRDLRRRNFLPPFGNSGESARRVSYCATCDGAFYQNKTVAVVGGGDTALEDALYLSRMAKQVYLVHRRDAFRANASLQKQVAQTGNIVPVLCAVPTEIVGEKHVEALKLLHNDKPEDLQLDGVFVAIGSVPNTELLRGIAALDASGYVVAGEDGVTSVSGLFAAGDVRTKLLRQVVTAAADGANCVASAEKYLLH